MSLTSVSDYIDFLTDRIGVASTDAATRARCLDWLQVAEFSVWSQRDWWFKRYSFDVALSAGVQDYALAIDGQAVYEVRVDGGAPLRYLKPGDFRELCTTAAVTGTAVFWTRHPNTSVDGAKIGIWPAPSGGGDTAAVVADAVAATLTDSASSYSGLPDDHRSVILDMALLKAMGHHNKVQAETLAGQAVAAGMVALEAADAASGKLE